MQIISYLLAFFLNLFNPPPTPSPAPIVIVTPSPSPTPTPTPTPLPALATPKALPAGTPPPKPTPSSLPVIQGPPGAGLTTATVSTEKGAFRATILSIDLSSSRMITDVSSDSDCSDNCPVLSLADFVAHNGGFAGVNGTYFCPGTYPDCQSKKNTFDFPVYITRLSKWSQADKLGWNERRAIVYTDGSGAHYLNNSSGFGGGLSAGIINYPGLLDGGNVQIDDNQSGLSDKQRAVGTKVGIGVVDSNHVLIIIAPSVNMQQFAYVFKALGVKGALNLDTGGSTALHYNGRYIYGPGRSLPNAIIFARK